LITLLLEIIRSCWWSRCYINCYQQKPPSKII